MGPYRPRPDWQALVFQQGVALLVGLKLLEGLAAGRWALYAGELFPWGRQVEALGRLPAASYWVLVAAQALGVVLLLARVRPRLTAALLALTVAFDTLAGLQNHRLLLTFTVALVALEPVPTAAAGRRYLDQRVHWNLDLQGALVAVVYLSTALHKVNPVFLSGEALQAVVWHVQREHGRLPAGLFAALQRQDVCQALSLLTLAIELALPPLLLWRRTCGWAIPLALALHLTFSLVMPWLWVFTGLMILSLVAFVPTRLPPGPHVLARGARRGGAWLLARLAWPGALTVDADASAGGRASEPLLLERADGTRTTGYAAWCDLLALSPATFLLAETARIRPLRWLGRRWLG